METADHLLIPLLDGTHTLAQIARIEDGRALLFLTRTRTDLKSAVKPLSPPQVIAGICVDVASIPSDLWTVIGYAAVPRLSGFVDRPLIIVDPIDPALIEAFVNAIHGLYPWDGFPDKDLFTNMLRTPDILPLRARMAADFPKPDDSA